MTIALAGVDLGGTKIQAVIVDSDHGVLGQARRPTPLEGGPPAVADEIAGAVREASETAGLEPGSLGAIGVGAPGAVDVRAGTVAHARNLTGWEGVFPLAATLATALGPPVFLGNDVNVAVEAEFRLGAAQRYSSMIGVWWGTGVGGGINLDGKPWLGRGAAGEIGHTVVKLNGARCPCGRRGCLEAYAGRAAMETHARRLVARGETTDLFEIMEKEGRTRLSSGVWKRALERDDKLAVALVARAIAALGAGIASVINLLDLEAVVIGGGLGTRLGQEYADRIAQAMSPHLFVPERAPAVHVAALGDLGGALGAALIAQAAGAKAARRSAPARGTGRPADVDHAPGRSSAGA
jgi:glucokinase